MAIDRRKSDDVRGTKVALIGISFFLAWAGAAQAQATTNNMKGTAPPVVADANPDALKGAWVRVDGRYTIAIRNIGTDGQIEAMYFNPNQVPFARAQVSQDGNALRASFELRAGGYAGSTYELTYDPASDRLSGVYYQAVAKQKFDVYFTRK